VQLDREATAEDHVVQLVSQMTEARKQDLVANAMTQGVGWYSMSPLQLSTKGTNNKTQQNKYTLLKNDRGEKTAPQKLKLIKSVCIPPFTNQYDFKFKSQKGKACNAN
jgi:hypothetical protein